MATDMLDCVVATALSKTNAKPGWHRVLDRQVMILNQFPTVIHAATEQHAPGKNLVASLWQRVQICEG